MSSGYKVAILLDDAALAERVAALAAACQMDVVRPQSFSWLQSQISDPHLSAVVIDLVGPRSGGFDGLEKLRAIPTRANIVVLTGLDSRTIESTKRLAESKGIELLFHRKDETDDETLRKLICVGRDRAPTFGPEELDDCLDKHYYRVEYQPKVPLTNPSQISEYGVEALCRILHPRFGNVSPELFIPMAEKSGLILRLTDAVVCDALRDHRSWMQSDQSFHLAINVSPELLKDAEWCDLFMQRCNEYSVQPEWITLEITESSAAATQPTALEVLTRLRLKGFTLSIDDFGTGFSSLSTLYRLPFGELKIDKSFICDLQKSAEARALIESTVSMAQKIGVRVVAEGVESESIFNELRLIGCHVAQGYFVGKAMPADKVIPYFADWAAMMRSQSTQAGSPNALPKIAMIQALLTDILNDNSADPEMTLVRSDMGKSRPADGEGVAAIELARKIPPLVLQGRTTEALANCHNAAALLEKEEPRSGLRSKIGQLQSLLEQELVSTADIEIASENGTVRLLSRLAANLGRPSSGAEVDIPLRCRWLSRGEKNLRFFIKGGQWFVEDRGSTNGNFINQKKLEPRRPFALPIGQTIVETGIQPGSEAALAMIVRRPAANQNVLVMTFSCDPSRMREELGDEQWTLLQADLKHTWIIFDGQLVAGSSPDVGLVLPECSKPVAATLRYRSGFWIAPAAGTELAIGNAVFTAEVPLPCGQPLDVAGASLKVRELDREDVATAMSQPALAVNN